METLAYIRDAIFTYSGVLLTLVISQVHTITAVGGLILLLLKIVVELPKAIAVLRSYFGRKNLDDEDRNRE